jgi:hypothetical protein
MSFNRELSYLEDNVRNRVYEIVWAVDNIVDNHHDIDQVLKNRKYIQHQLDDLLVDVVSFVDDHHESKITPDEQPKVEQPIKTDSTGMPIIGW